MKTKTYFSYPHYTNIRDIFNYTINVNRDRIAFTYKEKNEDKSVKFVDISFKQFEEDVKNLGTALVDLGMENKKVAVISKNRYEWLVTYFATLNGNMDLIPLDKGLTEGELASSLSRCTPDVLIYGKDIEDNVEYAKMQNILENTKIFSMEKDEEESIYGLIKKGKEIRANGNNSYDDIVIDEEKASIYSFTSGTSSTSKIVMLSHKNIASNIYALNEVEYFLSTDVSFQILPLHHMFGSTGFLVMFSNGMKTVFPDGLRYIQQNMKEYGVSVFVGVPLLVESIYKKIDNEIKKQKKEKLIYAMRKITNLCPSLKRKIFKPIIDQLGGKLRLVVSGAAALDKETWEGFNEMGITLVQGYGLTEASPVVAAENYKVQKMGSVGMPMPNVECRIENPNELGIGELAVSGPNVMLGYYENEEATKKTFTEDGWLLTGDLAYIDKNGRVYITGREKNVIVLKNGKNVFPEEIEAIINKIPEVDECMVYGNPDGDDLVVSVKAKLNEEYIKENCPNASDEELEKIIWEKIKEINRTMPTYKYVKKLVITRDEFEKTTTAKIKRYVELKKMGIN